MTPEHDNSVGVGAAPAQGVTDLGGTSDAIDASTRRDWLASSAEDQVVQMVDHGNEAFAQICPAEAAGVQQLIWESSVERMAVSCNAE